MHVTNLVAAVEYVNSDLTHGGISRVCVTLTLPMELQVQVSGRDFSERGVVKRIRNVDMQMRLTISSNIRLINHLQR